jgi:hypothetical protein
VEEDQRDFGHGTVRNSISAILDKLKATNRTQVVAIAIEKGLLEAYPETKRTKPIYLNLRNAA